MQKLSFSRFWRIILKGSTGKLGREDIAVDVPKDSESLKLGDQLSRHWENEIALSKNKGRKPTFVRAVFKAFGVQFILYGLIGLFTECVLRLIAPVLFGRFILFYVHPQNFEASAGFELATLLLLCYIAMSAADALYNYFVSVFGMNLRIACCTLVFRKTLRLSSKALGETAVGRMVNLMSNDVNRFDSFAFTFHYLWIAPLQAILAAYVIYIEFGIAGVISLVLVVIYLPIFGLISKQISKYISVKTVFTDKRVRTINEMLLGIKVIKMYAWENTFKKIIEEARRLEINVVSKCNYLTALGDSMQYVNSAALIFPVTLFYVLEGETLTAEKVFPVFSLLTILQVSLSRLFPKCVTDLLQANVTFTRIEDYLLLEERADNPRVVTSQTNSHRYAIEANKLTASWDSNSQGDTLSKVSFSLKTGDTMAIIGSVGSGKSSIINVILNELPLTDGNLAINGKISYAAQDPWIFSGSVRENILFGQPYIYTRYKEVIEVCGLNKDMEMLPEGDMSEVGERGITLSGGQKMRINLARAVYFEADIYLLDDPLSAVDVHVGKHLFEECISKFLKKKTVVLATHQTHFVKFADHILILNDGQIEAQGSYEELKTEHSYISRAVSDKYKDQKQNYKPPAENIETLNDFKQKLESVRAGYGTLDASSAFSSSREYDESTPIVKRVEWNEDCEKNNLDAKKKRTIESKSKRSVLFKVYFRYFAAGGKIPFIFMLILSVASEVLFSGANWWLSNWTNAEMIEDQLSGIENSVEVIGASSSDQYTTSVSDTSLYYIYVFTALLGGVTVVFTMRSFVFYYICTTSSKNLHNVMTTAVIRSPMSFFEVRPLGEILNRFTKDMGQVDEQLPYYLSDSVVIMLSFVGSVANILVSDIWVLVPTMIFMGLFILFGWVYVALGRDLKRYEAIYRTPVFSHLLKTFEGMPTVRALGAQETSVVRFDAYQNEHSSVYWVLILMTRALAGMFSEVTSIYIGIIAFSFLFQNGVLAGDIGLAMSMAFILVRKLQYGIKQCAEAENVMTSVERIIEYCELPPEESDEERKNKRSSSEFPGWPKRGDISFENVFLRYNEFDPPVLKNLSFKIAATEKIGIVGRTGAGKSSIITCLFRLTPPTGKIIIDGVQTDILRSQDLRRALSIIPQDPTLVSGTIRYNIDPFSNFTDQEIWDVLEEAQMKSFVSEMNEKLGSFVSDGGKNLSVGQRQLLCMARAILQHNKILIMDEATANVDLKTDNLIQKTIREKFFDCTIITIAHRLHTIMDYDKVLVMDSGSLKEFASPHELLENRNSLFSQLVQQTEPSTSAQLRNIAKQAYAKKMLNMKTRKNLQNTMENLQPAKKKPLNDFDATSDDILFANQIGKTKAALLLNGK